MKTNYRATYIISYYHSPHNLNILTNTIDMITNNNPNIQIIIVESGSESKNLNERHLNSEYIFLKNTKNWNLGWMYNISTDYAKTDKLFFGDVRFMPRPDVIEKVIELENENDKNINDEKNDENSKLDMIYFQEHLIYVDKREIEENRITSENKLKTQSFERGILYFRKSGLDRIGRFDENVYGDYFYQMQELKSQFLNKSKVDGAYVYEAEIDEFNMNDYTVYEKSINHYNKIKDLNDPNDMFKYFQSSYKKMGDPNKYNEYDVLNETISY